MTDNYRAAKADARAEKARAKAMRPWFKKKRFIIPLALVALGIIASVGSSGGGTKDANANDNASATTAANDAAKSDFSTNSDHPPADDVTLVSCTKTVIDTVDVQLDVTNHSSKESNYTMELSIEDSSGAKIGDGFASTDNVNPGQVAHVKGVATLDSEASQFSCKVEKVERFAA